MKLNQNTKYNYDYRRLLFRLVKIQPAAEPNKTIVAGSGTAGKSAPD